MRSAPMPHPWALRLWPRFRHGDLLRFHRARLVVLRGMAERGRRAHGLRHPAGHTEAGFRHVRRRAGHGRRRCGRSRVVPLFGTGPDLAFETTGCEPWQPRTKPCRSRSPTCRGQTASIPPPRPCRRPSRTVSTAWWYATASKIWAPIRCRAVTWPSASGSTTAISSATGISTAMSSPGIRIHPHPSWFMIRRDAQDSSESGLPARPRVR